MMLRPILLVALLSATPGMSALPRPGRTIATDYVLARAAGAAGDLSRAAAGYQAALAIAPGDAALALRALRQSIAAGDRAGALVAAGRLTAADRLPPDGRLLLLTEAIGKGDYPAARAELAKVPQDDPLSFMAPVIAAWIARGEKRDALAPLMPGKDGAAGQSYLAEHRALLLASLGRHDEAASAMAALNAGSGGARATRLKLALAAARPLHRAEDRAAVLALLAGDDAALVRARAIVASGRALPAAVTTPADGVAELFVRVAADLNRDRVTPLALSLARMATFLSPANAETWLVTANLLALSGSDAAAVAALARIDPADPFAETARDARLRLLVRQGQSAAALKEALAATAAADADAGDWSRLGELRTDAGDLTGAAAAFARAIALAERAGATPAEISTLWLARGSVLEQTGDWAAARPMVERAVALAPDRPDALNLLGYAMLQHGGDVTAATALIERASRLAPDDPAITDSLGWAYFRQGRLAQAIAALERAAAGEPGDSEINEHLGDAYHAAGRGFEARHAWAAARIHADAAARRRIDAKIDPAKAAGPTP